MNSNFFFQLPSIVLLIMIFLLILLFNWLGYRFKKSRLAKKPGMKEGMGGLEGSMLGILALLLGFTFSLATTKLELRRHLIVDEATEIEKAILLCDLYPDSVRNPLRADFKEYVEARISYYDSGINEDKIHNELKRAAEISHRIWKRVADQSSDLDNRVRSLQMIPSVTAVIDIVTTRDASRLNKIPALVSWTLLFLVLIGSFLLGTDYQGKTREHIIITGYALVITLTLNLINELNHPRSGFINLHDAEAKIVELRELVK